MCGRIKHTCQTVYCTFDARAALPRAPKASMLVARPDGRFANRAGSYQTPATERTHDTSNIEAMGGAGGICRRLGRQIYSTPSLGGGRLVTPNVGLACAVPGWACLDLAGLDWVVLGWVGGRLATMQMQLYGRSKCLSPEQARIRESLKCWSADRS